MNDHRQRIDPVTAERLMRGARADLPANRDPLAGLLAAATVPARPGELTAEEAAVCDFRNARLEHTPESAKPFVLTSALARLTTAKVAVVLAAAGSGCLALAAGTGHLPGTNSPEHHTTARPSPSIPATAYGTASSTATTEQSNATPSHAVPPPDAAPAGSRSANLRQLCSTFRAGTGDDASEVLDDPAFTALITAAGGADQVARYCITLLAVPATTAPTQRGNQSTPAEDAASASSTSHTSPLAGGNSTHPSGATTTPMPPAHPTPTPTHPN
jgi:hypothetical protein